MNKSDLDTALAHMLHHRASSLSPGDPVTTPLSLASAFHLPGDADKAAYQYGRFHNPTWVAYEQAMTELERGSASVVFSSGMAAVAAMLGVQLG